VAGLRDADAEPGKTATHPAFLDFWKIVNQQSIHLQPVISQTPKSQVAVIFSNPTSISSGGNFSNPNPQVAVISQTQPISQVVVIY
jgi:hypothetical protein